MIEFLITGVFGILFLLLIGFVLGSGMFVIWAIYQVLKGAVKEINREYWWKRK